jgi:hypothetical protein
MAWQKKQEVKKEEYAGNSGGTVVAENPATSAPVASGSPATGTEEGWTRREVKFEGTFFKFERIGESLTGTWQGDYKAGVNPFGKPNHNGKIQTSDGVALVGLTANLVRQLVDLPIGTEIKIVYNGKQLSPKSHNYYHDFTVLTKAK